MTILITAGPTSEKIDAVRHITNRATGRLGALVAEAFCEAGGQAPDKIIYVCEKGAQEPAVPGKTRVEVVHTSGTIELAAAITDILIREQPDAVIHSMAVSDYRVARVTDSAGATIDKSKKISSDMDSLLVRLERTPKIIALVKPAAPDAVLVGFKLLDSVSTETLVYAASGLLRKNGCDFVFANDAKEIEGDGHAGYIVKGDRTYRRVEGKKNIAREIVRETLAEIARKKKQERKGGERMKNVLLGITGSIAAYKAADIANELIKSGCEVDVVMTKAACEFIAPLTMQTIAKRKINTNMFDEIVPGEVRHISLAQKADVFLVAPASADIIAKFACGIADDFLSTIALALPRGTPKIIAPAMNTAMWDNAIVRENLSRLERAGFSIIEPREARLACGDVGKGALADVGLIVSAALAAASGDDDISAGKTEA